MMKRKKRNYARLPHDSVAKQDEYFQNACIKWDKILSKLPSNKTFLQKNYQRLSGGADVVDVDEIIQNADELLADSEAVESPLNEPTPPDGNKNIEEIVACVFEKLHDANKALGSLGENHEQEFKLMLAEITKKIQNWMEDVQLKIDAAASELKNLQTELKNRDSEAEAKDKELTELKMKLKESEDLQIINEKELNKDVHRTIPGPEGLVSEHSSIHTIPRDPKHPESRSQTSGLMSKSQTSTIQSIEGDIQQEQQEKSSSFAASHGTNKSAISSHHSTGNNPATGTSLAPTANSVSSMTTRQNQPLTVSPSSSHQVQDNQRLAVPAAVRNDDPSMLSSQINNLPIDERSALSGQDTLDISRQQTSTLPGQISTISGQEKSFLPGQMSMISGQEKSSLPEQISTVTSQQKSVLSAQLSTMPEGQKKITYGKVISSTIHIEQLPSYDEDNQSSSSPFNPSYRDGQFNHNDREINQKLTDLEAECVRLKNENEKLLKEQAEYENKIHQALLRGVSCLNVEALKVLKNPPLTCCFPCSPCNNPSTNNAKKTSPAKIMRDNWTPQGDKSVLPPKFDGICRPKEKPPRTQKKATTISGSSGKNSPQQNSMIFLLPQQQVTSNTCPVSFPRFCARPNDNTAKSIVKEKNNNSRKSSNNRANCDILYSVAHETPPSIYCTDIFTSSGKRNFDNSKQCEPCNRTKRFYDD